jgi:putative transposase
VAIINYSVSKGDLIMPPIRPELLDELLKDYQQPDDLLGQDGLLQQLTKALVERALDGELTHHLGYEKHSSEGDNSGNSRNGTTPKTMKGKRGQVQSMYRVIATVSSSRSL